MPRQSSFVLPLFQALKLALAFDDVLVVPLDRGGFLEPALEVGRADVARVGEACLGGFEGAFGREAGFVEGLAAPEEQADAVLELVVADDGVAIDEPDRVAVPDIGLDRGAGCTQIGDDDRGEGVTDRAVAGREGGVIGESTLR